MRLSRLCVAALRLSLTLAVILLFTFPLLAQHGGGGSSGGSSSGGSSSGGSSSGASSGGGSHGSGGSGGSSSSGGGHSSGGSASHSSGSGHNSGGSASHSSNGFSSGAGVNLSRTVEQAVRSGDVRITEIRTVTDSGVRVVLDRDSTRQVVAMVKAGKSEEQIREFMRARANAQLNPFAPKTQTREHRSFFGFFRRPFGKHETATDLRHRICLSGPCVVCPSGGGHKIGGGCAGAAVVSTRNVCASGQYWNGGACFGQTSFPNDCSAQRQALQQQAQRMQTAQAEQQSACSTGPSQDCSDRTSASQNEEARYSTLQEQYRVCRQRTVSGNPFGHNASSTSSRGLLLDPLKMGVE